MKIVKSLIVIMAVVAVAAGATGAYFSDAKSIAGNSFTTGTLTLDVTHGALKPWAITNFAPGYCTPWESASATNTGSIAGNLTIATAMTGGNLDLYNALTIEVRNNTSAGAVLYGPGPINGANIGPYPLNVNQTRTGVQQVCLPNTGNQNNLQNTNVTFDEVFTLTQP